jgi:putative tryptophan/tyrosine transport system substrate-binding protein
MTSRRQFLIASALSAIAADRAFAQARPVKVGMLVPRSIAESIYASGVVTRLGELGYRDGSGMVLEYRSANGFADRYPKLARELIDLKCEVIFAIGDQYPARALRDARSSVPVVFLAVDYDPLEIGIITSLARPDSNITGVYVPQNALVAKRLEIMREVVPAARRFLVFADIFSRDQISAVRRAAEATGVELTVVEFAKQPYDFAAAFEAGRKAEVGAFVTLASPVFTANRAVLSALLTQHALPSIGSALQHINAGFLLSFGAEDTKVARRVAEMGARVLKGAKPADIPVEQAAEFELAVNVKTARTLGVKIPESVLARATRIVQ